MSLVLAKIDMVLLIHTRAFSCTVKTRSVAFVVAIKPWLIACLQTFQHCVDAGAVTSFRLFRLAVVAELVLRTLSAAIVAVVVAGAVINAGKVLVEALKKIPSVCHTVIENDIAGIDA